VAVAADAEDTPRRRDFFSCPTCKLPLSDQFWEHFPDYLVEAQRSRSADCLVSLEQVHRRIVANALRRLRQDASSTIARCDSSQVMKGRYIIALTAEQSVTCMGRAFDSVADFRNFTDHESLPSCGLSVLQLSQWQHLTHAAQAASGKLKSTQTNSAGAIVKQSAKTGLVYCGRILGTTVIPHSDGQCGPVDGPQCSDCKAYASAAAETDDLQPTFVSDSERPRSQRDMLTDFRMCPKCFGGYYINTNCPALGSHHGEHKDGAHVQNVCTDCGFFSPNWAEWPRADERLKASKIKSIMPYLKSTTTATTAIQS